MDISANYEGAITLIMNAQEKAKIILEALDEYVQIDWNFEEFYIKGIVKGLNEIEGSDNE